MIEQMGTEYLKTLLEQDTKAIGEWTSSMDKGKKSLRKKGQFMKGISMKGKNMAQVLSSGKTEAITKGTLSMESMKEKASTISLIKDVNMMENF